MSKALIIAEKPSLAKNIAAAIVPTPKWVTVDAKKHTGYYENDSFIVMYSYGHLLEEKDAEEYDPNLKKWSVGDLPIIPAQFERRPKDDSGSKAQLALIKKMVHSSSVNRIVNAGDSDREGEIIVRNILEYCENKKPVYRLWMPDQTIRTIQNELAGMRKDSEYDNLAEEGYARTYIDWLYGINLTRLASVKSSKLLRVGRVTSPIVMAIYEREMEIRNFNIEKYYVPVHDKDGLKLTSEKKCDTAVESNIICDRYNRLPLKVVDKTTERETVTRPKLFALSDLQNAMGKKYKMTPKDTLDVLQSLYEAGYVTYPRTNSNYMAEEEKDKAKDIISAIKTHLGNDYAGIEFRDSKSIFNNKEIEAHSAITPTYKVPSPQQLDGTQWKVYATILNRFAAVFCKEDRIIDRTTIKITNGEEDFAVSGFMTVSKGFALFEPAKDEESLPNINKGDIIEPAFNTVEKETTPPKHYTVTTLNEYLKHPYSKSEKKDLSDAVEKEILDDVELGTEATRAGLIDAAIKSTYITLDNNKYGITKLGEYYCETLNTLGIDMQKERTLNLSIQLKAIYRGKSNIKTAMEEAKEDIESIIDTGKSIKEVKQMDREVFCACPKCGGTVYENKMSWSCADRNCGCAIFKNDFFFNRFGKQMTAALAKSLMVRKYADVKGFTSQKTGKKFDARVIADFSGKYVQYKLEFR